MTRESRRLGEHGDVGVEHPVTPGADHLEYRAHEAAAVGTAPLRVIVAEVLPDVAESGGPEQRVTEGVENHVAVGMSDDTVSVRHADTTQHDVLARPE